MILLIGYGNPLRSDDGAGRLVVDRAIAHDRIGVLRSQIEHQLYPEMVEDLSDPEIDGVVFVDASDVRATGCREAACRPVRASAAVGTDCHQLSPEHLLAMTDALFGRSPPAWLVTVPGEFFGHGDSLSLFSRCNCDTASQLISQLILKTRAPAKA